MQTEKQRVAIEERAGQVEITPEREAELMKYFDEQHKLLNETDRYRAALYRIKGY